MPYTHSALKIGTAIIGGISRQSVKQGTETRSEVVSGELYSRYTSMTGYSPVYEFDTFSLKQIIDAIGMITDISGISGGVELYAQLTTPVGRASGATHQKYVAVNGVILPTSITCEAGGDAKITVTSLAIGDATNAPHVITNSVALPTPVTDTERFALGTFAIGGVTIGNIQSLNIDFGVDAQTERFAGSLWPTEAWARAIKPVITLTGTNMTDLGSSAITQYGLAATHANTTIYLRKREIHGSFVSDITAEHIKITAAGMATIDDAMESAGDSLATIGLKLECEYDGTNAPLIFDTASAIT